MPFFLVRFMERLIYDLGLKREKLRLFELDEALIHSVQDLARREGRSPGEVASGLVAEALERRQAAGELLRIWQGLSMREQEVAALACLGYTNPEIAEMLFLSEETVKTHLQRILRKFGLRRKDQLLLAFSEWDFSAWDRKGVDE